MSIGDKGKYPFNESNKAECIVSKSIEEQNKYLYNYVHKLEFLITQSQQERAEFPLKFNRVINHIVHSLVPNISDDKKIHRVLKSIEMTKPDIDEVQIRKELATDDTEQKDFLLEALSIGSKPFNNYESGYVPNISEKSDLNPILDQYPWDSIKKTEVETSSSLGDRTQFDKIREL